MNSQAFSLLSHRGSLTKRFKQVMGVSPSLTRLSQGYLFPSQDEKVMLDIKPRQVALIREIKMGKKEQNWLFARTVVPLQTLTGSAKRITALNNAPIGKILFGRNGAKRRWMQVSLTHNLPKSVIELGVTSDQKLWQRQSIFEFNSGLLMVSELFLPDCPIYDF